MMAHPKRVVVAVLGLLLVVLAGILAASYWSSGVRSPAPEPRAVAAGGRTADPEHSQVNPLPAEAVGQDAVAPVEREAVPTKPFVTEMLRSNASVVEKVEALIRAKQELRHDPAAYARASVPTISSEDRPSTILSDPRINPEHKELTSAQMARLGQLIAERKAMKKAAAEVDMELHDEATLAALHRGQYEVLEVAQSDDVNRRLVTGIKQRLNERFGRETVDWRCAQVFWTSSGGESRMVVVWYTKEQEPDPFVTSAEVGKFTREDPEVYRRFLADL